MPVSLSVSRSFFADEAFAVDASRLLPGQVNFLAKDEGAEESVVVLEEKYVAKKGFRAGAEAQMMAM